MPALSILENGKSQMYHSGSINHFLFLKHRFRGPLLVYLSLCGEEAQIS